ncbi:MAG: DUF4013 domain-containing protein [Planctomycetaceae bacterium]|nr:DUF4013 domain-containing protein [Planctomycetales bacterium]MCB9875638.1 DUF4013 domain-containing protein [Planctomycetaceae bacterium]MCB9939968.1 DUF4013 domain-containing protein [Planctomycetaceae bacterium]
MQPQPELPTITDNGRPGHPIPTGEHCDALSQGNTMSTSEPPRGELTPPEDGHNSTSDSPSEVDSQSAVGVFENAPPPVRVFTAEGIEEEIAVVDERSLPVKAWQSVCSSIEWMFGLASVIAGLALLASIPIVQFLSLGYLLEVSGRITRTGKLREGFIGIRPAARLGSIVLGTWLMLWPIRLVSSYWHSSYLIDPTSGQTAAWRIGLLIFTAVMVGHILLAWTCGGKIRHFFWPLLAPLFFGMWLLRKVVSSTRLRPIVGPVVGTFSKRLLKDLTTVPPLTSWFPPAIFWSNLRRGGLYSTARDAVWDYAVNLRAPYFFWLGLRGFAGAITWLFVPVMMIIAMTNFQLENEEAARGLGGLSAFFGSILLAAVVLYLPFLQAHFAAENRFVAMFEIGEVRRKFQRAPIAFWFSLLITLGFSLPLYLLKVEYVPRETVWLPSVVFVIFILPARIITGWALARAEKREQPRYFLFRWGARLGSLPLVLFYAFIAFFTQFLSWYGSYSLFEQHAFLTPVPFLGL